MTTAPRAATASVTSAEVHAAGDAAEPFVGRHVGAGEPKPDVYGRNLAGRSTPAAVNISLMMFSATNGHRIKTATAAGVLRMTMPRPKPSRLTMIANTTMPINADWA